MKAFFAGAVVPALFVVCLQLSMHPALADDTATSTPASQAESTATPTTQPSPTPTPTVTPPSHPVPAATAVATPATERPLHKKRRHHHRKAHPLVEATATPTPARTRHRHDRRRSRAKKKATATPTPTPTATPPINLTAEDSISPVACNGPGKPVASHPFLDPPFLGWTSLVSFFDHDMPNFYRDGLIVTASGMQAQPDASHHASAFPAYWNPQMRQYVNYDGHNGYDFDLWFQPVLAAAAGKVIYAAYEYRDAPDHGYGKMVMVDHRNGYITLYGHFDKILVKRGQRVKRGQLLGVSGNTGHSSGPHLHFTVFHNCTPVDPYGWSGPGADPLVGYKGESSTYLWIRQPLITNPPRGWPGLARLPPTSDTRYLLVGLPRVTGGTKRFTAALRRELRDLRARLGAAGKGARIDMLHGALKLAAPISAEHLYLLPSVASIAAPDVVSDARGDLLAALARASLEDHRRLMHLNRSPSWTGTVVQWEGRTLLVGKGIKGKRVDFHIPKGGRVVVRRVQADPSSGAYVLDLGTMTKRQIELLKRELQGTERHTPALTIDAAGHGGPIGESSAARSTFPYAAVGLVLGLALALIASLAYVGFLRRRSPRLP